MNNDESIFGGDDSQPASGDSAILNTVEQPRLLQVYATDPLLVVGFGGVAIPDDHNLAAYRDEIVDLLAQHGRSEVAVDLTGVLMVPSGIVGLLVSLTRRDVSVSVYNACADVREVFAVTQVDRLVTLHDVKIPASDTDAD